MNCWQDAPSHIGKRTIGENKGKKSLEMSKEPISPC